jgi:hypothetical protein
MPSDLFRYLEQDSSAEGVPKLSTLPGRLTAKRRLAGKVQYYVCHPTRYQPRLKKSKLHYVAEKTLSTQRRSIVD